MPIVKKYAFLVGINKYKYGFQNLHHASRHVKEFKNILYESKEFEEVVVLSEDGDENHKPKTDNILIQYSRLAKKFQPHDLLIAYFICHGAIFEGKSCIFPENASKESRAVLKKTSIPLSYFLEEELVANSFSETLNIFFFFDICQAHMVFRSHGGTDKNQIFAHERLNEVLGIKPIEIKEVPSGISQFYACSSNERAWVFKENGEEYSVFSYALLKGLKEGIKPPITYAKLVAYVKNEIQILLERYPEIPFQEPKDLSTERAKNIVLIMDLPRFSKEKAKSLSNTILIDDAIKKKQSLKTSSLKAVKIGDLGHDVFICHSSKDKEIADATCHFLEQNGIKCWIAPRDVSTGSYASSIVKAIKNSKIMILIFTNNVNSSSQVKRELEQAVKRHITIQPFRTEDVEPIEEIDFYISSMHWLDALTPPLEKHLSKLAERISQLLKGRA